MTTFQVPTTWQAQPYGGCWSFVYSTEPSEREEYDFCLEFNETVTAAEERSVLALLEAAPQLLVALAYLLEQTIDQDLKYGIELTEGEEEAHTQARAALAVARGERG